MSQLFDPDADYQESTEAEYVRPLNFSGLDRYLTRVDPWPSTDDVEDMNLAVPFCGSCGFRHSVGMAGCKARIGDAKNAA